MRVVLPQDVRFKTGQMPWVKVMVEVEKNDGEKET